MIKKGYFVTRDIKKQLSKDLLVLLKKADLFYENSWISIIKLKKKYGIPISIAAELYRKIGKKIIQKNGNIWINRIYINFIEKVFFSIIVIFKLYFSKNLFHKNDVEKNLILMLKKLNVKFN